MIRFYEPDVWNFYKDECNRMGLLQFFLQKEYNDSIVLLNDQNGNFIGTVTYNSILHNIKYDDCIQHNKIIIDQGIFQQARKYLELQPEVPVFNTEGELLYFCYDDKRGMLNSQYENVIAFFENNDNGLFIENIYEHIQAVHFYDLNEWAYRIYKILEKRNVTSYVTGQKWEELVDIKQTMLMDYPEYNVMSIYSESTDNFKSKGKSDVLPCTIFDFIEKIAMANQLNIAQCFKNSHINQMFICHIPEFDELNYYTSNESLRNTKRIHAGVENLNTNNYVIRSTFENAIEMPFDEFYRQRQFGIDEVNKVYFKFNGRNIEGFQWGHGKYRIYLVGPCIVDIKCTLKEETLMAYLQQYLVDLSPPYEIVSIPIFYMEIEVFEKLLKALPLNTKDIVIYIDFVDRNILKNSLFCSSTDIDLLSLFNNREHGTEWFFDKPIHTTKHANKQIAKELSQLIIPKVDNLQSSETLCNDVLGFSEISYELKNYLDLISVDKPNNPLLKIGSIVMNCNPFTLGHQHLITVARNQVDLLYIFVVEEDKSFFQFKDRIELVKECCRDYDNVKILPSGKYVLSYETFPLYFEKEIQQEAVIDASLDLDIFARYIAPTLNITTRFVGEEPVDKITKQYNLEMIKHLPSYGINVVEIPRIEVENEPISASKVRRLLKQQSFEDMRKLLPEATFQYLIKNYKKF